MPPENAPVLPRSIGDATRADHPPQLDSLPPEAGVSLTLPPPASSGQPSDHGQSPDYQGRTGKPSSPQVLVPSVRSGLFHSFCFLPHGSHGWASMGRDQRGQTKVTSVL